ncbi:hypothetical protein BY458DRAFT_560535 [Sporodiniella umbellata]|nr:hypothetical protein BY458DRAFT_560535 [Sporodiniella umbellata]
MQAQEKLKKEKLQAEEDRKEAESVMEAMREETEKVMAELEASERRAVQYRGQVERLERDLLEGGNPEEGLLREARIQSEGLRRDLEDQAIASREREKSLEDQSKVLVHRHTLQVAALTLEKEELRQRLVKAEQRSSENAKGWEVERKKVKVQGDRELEEALGRSVAEKEKELALLKKTLEKNERAMEKTEAVYAQRLERECAVHRQDLQEGLQKQYRQQTDAFQLQVTRELRAMACQIADLETDLESAARENRQQQKVILALQAGASTLQDIDHRSLQQRQATEKELQTTIAQLHIQVASLEKESLVLYSKNLELAHQLGELEP